MIIIRIKNTSQTPSCEEVVESDLKIRLTPRFAQRERFKVTRERCRINKDCSREKERMYDHSLFPGTKMNRQQSATSMMAIQARHVRARLLRSFLQASISTASRRQMDEDVLVSGGGERVTYRMNGSWIRAKLMKVYSLYPTTAIRGSSIYW